MSVVASEVEKNVVKKVVDNWDNNGLAFFFALIGATAFCFASVNSDDQLSLFLQLFGIFVLYTMMLRIPVYFVAKEKGFSDKSSASLGLTVCFAIMTFLLTVEADKRDLFYYFGLCITLMFSLLMVWRMNMKDSRLSVRKTYTASTVVLLAQSVFYAILLSDSGKFDRFKVGTQALLIIILLLVCTVRLVIFLRNRESIATRIIDDNVSDA